MITVKVKKREQAYLSFSSKGHAGYAEEGYDIVCAAVSALIITAVNSLDSFTDEEFTVEENDGYVSFQFKQPTSERGTLLMDSLLLGLTQIEQEYHKQFLTVRIQEV